MTTHFYAYNDGSGNDANDGLTPGTAKQNLSAVYALADPLDETVVHLKGTHTQPTGGWVCAWASQQYIRRRFIIGDDATAQLTLVDRLWHTTSKYDFVFCDLTIVRNYAAASYAQPNMYEARFIRCEFSSIGSPAYHAIVDCTFLHCVFHSGNMSGNKSTFVDCLFRSTTNFATWYNAISFCRCRFEETISMASIGAGNARALFEHCSFENGNEFNKLKWASANTLVHCVFRGTNASLVYDSRVPDRWIGNYRYVTPDPPDIGICGEASGLLTGEPYTIVGDVWTPSEELAALVGSDNLTPGAVQVNSAGAPATYHPAQAPKVSGRF